MQAYQKKLKGNKIGVVFGSFAPLHQGHLDLIFKAKKECDGGCIVIVCGYDGDKGEPFMPHEKRYRYVREFFENDDLVAVYSINDTKLGLCNYPLGWEGWLKEFNSICEKNAEYKERIWYVGEKIYFNDLVQRQEKVILVNREINAISGTMIRNNPIKYWNKIALPFKRVFSTNILICGTASEGKTNLTKDLAKYFNTSYSSEYARNYMQENCLCEWELTQLDFIAFLNGQFQLNKKQINSNANCGVFFADTDSMVTKMYAEYYSQDSNLSLTKKEFENIAQIADIITQKCKWDKIYLLYPNGVFVDDHIRYKGHSELEKRNAMFNILVKNIQNAGLWNKVVLLKGGEYLENFETIKNDVRRLLKNEKI